ncbi:MAG: amidohydrolase family protein [Clostridiales bacterium]|nr:amidohydrolase family protein [Clostridiales bacterium]
MADRTKLLCAALLTPLRRLESAEVTIEDGRIAHVGGRDRATDVGCRLVDAGCALVTPGLIDIHVHGGGGHDFMDGTPDAFWGAARLHARFGTTTLLPTSLTCREEQLMPMIDAYLRALPENDGADMPGLHLEGPYLSPGQAGAQDPDALALPDRAQIGRILAAAAGRVARWTLAPELPGAMAAIGQMRAAGVVPSIGHSDATDAIVAQAVENGCTHITHLYSATSTIVRRNSYRFPGVLESAYLFPEMTAELIADGRHLPGSLLSLAYRALGAARASLVTDALRGAGLPDGPSRMGPPGAERPCIVENGVALLPDRSAFAGSVATADRLIRTIVAEGGASPQDAIKMMTTAPTAAMALGDRGRLAPGLRADLAFWSADWRVTRTMVAGRFVDG